MSAVFYNTNFIQLNRFVIFKT